MKILKQVFKSDIRSDGLFLFDLVKEYIYKGKTVAYILPTTFAIDSKRNQYLERLGAISNIKFYSFDSFRNANIEKNLVDGNIIKSFLFERLSQRNYKYIKNTSGIIDVLLEFIRKAREDEIEIKDTSNEFFSELMDIYKAYLGFLRDKNLADLFMDFKSKQDLDLVIVDGFFSIKNVDFSLIKKNFDNIDTLVNIPYYIGSYFFNEKLVENFKDAGYEIIDRCGQDGLEPLLEDLSKKISLVKSKSSYHRQRDLIKLVKSNIEDIDIINFSKQDLDFNQYLAIEDIRINGQKNKTSSLKFVKELLILLNYMAKRSRTNMIKRLGLVYFPVLDDLDGVVEEFEGFSFKNYEDLYEASRTSVDLNYLDPNSFYEIMNGLDEKIKKKASFDYYCGVVDDLLERASEKILEVFEKTGDEKLFISNNKIRKDIKKKLDIFRTYDRYFKEVDIGSFLEILEEGLETISTYNKNYKDPSIYKIDQALYVKYKKVILEGLDLSYPNYDEKNPIFNRENKEILKDLNFEYIEKEEIYKRSVLRLIKLLCHLEKAYIIDAEDKSDRSALIKLFKNIKEEKIEKISSKDELALSIISDLKNKTIDEVKFREFFKYGSFSGINEKIYNEEKRKINQDIIISSDALDLIKDLVENRDFHATDFDYYLRSAYGFLYGRLLGLEELENDSQEYIDMGNLYHKVLEEYFKKNRDSLSEEDLVKMVSSNIRSIFARDIDKNIILDRVFFETIYDRLRDFIEMDLSTRRGNLPSKFEEGFSLEINKLKIKGRVDRIDDYMGYKIITDYKSSTAASKKSIEEFKSFQMPIYMMAFDRVIEARYGLVKDASYRKVLGVDISDSKSKKDLSPEQMQEFIDQVKDQLEDLILRILGGNFTSLDGKYDDSAFKNMLREARY